MIIRETISINILYIANVKFYILFGQIIIDQKIIFSFIRLGHRTTNKMSIKMWKLIKEKFDIQNPEHCTKSTVLARRPIFELVKQI